MLTKVIDYIVQLNLKIKQIVGGNGVYFLVCYDSNGTNFLYAFKENETPILVDTNTEEMYVTRLFSMSDDTIVVEYLVDNNNQKKYKKKIIKF